MSTLVKDNRSIRAAAARRMAKPAPYDGRIFRVLIGLEIKAHSEREAVRRTETLLAELVTGAKIEATDLWVRSANLYDGSPQL